MCVFVDVHVCVCVCVCVRAGVRACVCVCVCVCFHSEIGNTLYIYICISHETITMSATMVTSVNGRLYFIRRLSAVVFAIVCFLRLSPVPTLLFFPFPQYTETVNHLIAIPCLSLGAGTAADDVRRLEGDWHCRSVLQRRTTNRCVKRRCPLRSIYAHW